MLVRAADSACAGNLEDVESVGWALKRMIVRNTALYEEKRWWPFGSATLGFEGEYPFTH